MDHPKIWEPVAMEEAVKIREARIRRALWKAGYRLRKTPARSWQRAHYPPGYMIISDRDIVAVGAAQREFDATLADVERFAFERLSQT